MSAPPLPTTEVLLHGPGDLAGNLTRWESFVARRGPTPLSYHPAWPAVLAEGLGHTPYWLEAVAGDETRGLLPLALVRSLLFGRFLVGLPYLNYGGVIADDDEVAHQLIDRAIGLADQLNVSHLELRHEHAVEHPRLTTRTGHKVHMRLPLPATVDELWRRLKPPVRNQIRKGQKGGLTVSWGGEESLPAFYNVFSRNMRDLGTPVYGRSLFRSILRRYPDRSEFCVVRLEGRTVAAALLLHGQGVTEVPSASSLRRYNSYCGNMLMYWYLLERAIQRSQEAFDFGRSTPGGSVFKFKEQWGAVPGPAEWQYRVRAGDASDMRPDNPRFIRLVRLWQQLPVGLANQIGPPIVRGIP